MVLGPRRDYFPMPKPPAYRASNPFRSANIRPGANDFWFPDPASWQQIQDQIRQHRSCQIIGPHGTGKSTLFHQLADRCESWGWQVWRHVIDPRQPTLEGLTTEAVQASAEFRVERLRGVDGYEQLTGSQRRALRKYCHTRGERLLITSHGPEGFHTLYKTFVDVPVARRVIVTILQRDGVDWQLDEARLESLLARHGGNLREVLFELFDIFAAVSASDPGGAEP